MKVDGRLCYAIAWAVLVAGGVALFRQEMGTNRLPIHLLAVVAALGYWSMSRRRGDTRQVLGLGRPRYTRWVWILPALGVLSGVLRYALYRSTGLGGLRLYEQEFVALLRGETAAEWVLPSALFLAGLYAAVVVPGVLFLGVIQETLSRAGWFPAGLLLQSAVFGLAHCWMAGSFDPVYGAEAFLGAAVSGLAFEGLKNVYVAALFMTASVLASTALLTAA